MDPQVIDSSQSATIKGNCEKLKNYKITILVSRKLQHIVGGRKYNINKTADKIILLQSQNFKPNTNPEIKQLYCR